ncbi:hypothetical protein, partial [Klebsiella quasipneumoniae]
SDPCSYQNPREVLLKLPDWLHTFMRITRSGEINLLLFAIPPGDVHDNTPRIVIQPVQRLNAARFWKHSAHQRLICNQIVC